MKELSKFKRFLLVSLIISLMFGVFMFYIGFEGIDFFIFLAKEKNYENYQPSAIRNILLITIYYNISAFIHVLYSVFAIKILLKLKKKDKERSLNEYN